MQPDYNQQPATEPARLMRQVDWISGELSAVESPAGVARHVPRARRKDPETSHEAARKVRAEANRQQLEILELVREHPGSTAIELAHAARGELWREYRFIVSRRLPELAHLGLVRRGRPRACRVAGTAQTTWHPIGRGESGRVAA